MLLFAVAPAPPPTLSSGGDTGNAAAKPSSHKSSSRCFRPALLPPPPMNPETPHAKTVRPPHPRPPAGGGCKGGQDDQSSSGLQSHPRPAAGGGSMGGQDDPGALMSEVKKEHLESHELKQRAEQPDAPQASCAQTAIAYPRHPLHLSLPPGQVRLFDRIGSPNRCSTECKL